jgi:hypothetical protein
MDPHDQHLLTAKTTGWNNAMMRREYTPDALECRCLFCRSQYDLGWQQATLADPNGGRKSSTPKLPKEAQ